MEKFSLIGLADRALRLVIGISDEYTFFGLMIDLSHITQMHETLETSVESVAPYIRHVHIAGAPRSRQRLMDIAVDNLRAFQAGSPQNTANP